MATYVTREEIDEAVGHLRSELIQAKMLHHCGKLNEVDYHNRVAIISRAAARFQREGLRRKTGPLLFLLEDVP